MGIVTRLKKAAKAASLAYSMADQAASMTAQLNNSKKANNNNPKEINTAVYNDGQMWSPGTPLVPMNQGKAPWQYQYRVGRNLVVNPRSEDPRLTPFQILRRLAETHDITAMCWKMMIDQVTGDEWDIVAVDKNDREHHEEDIDAVKQFFWKPDKVHLFNDWLKPYLTDILQIDAGTLYKRRTRSGKLYSLEYVNGETIKPLIDAYGRMPLSPNAAYQQIIYGVPYGSDNQCLGFTVDDIIYRPRYPRTWSPYGFAPTEQILMKINIALRRDNHLLDFYAKGSTPDGGLYSFDKEDMTPDQIEQFSELYNDIMSGESSDRWKLKFLPKGKYIDTKAFTYDVKLDEWLARLVAVSYGVNPQAFVMMMNRSTGQLQDQQQTDIGLGPLEGYLADGFTDIIQNELGYKHLKFKYIDEKQEDAAISVTKNVEYSKAGIITIDEVRSKIGMPPLTNMPDGVPAIIQVGNDIIPLTAEYFKAKTKSQLELLALGVTQGGNKQNNEAQAKQQVINKPQDNPQAAKTSTQDKVDTSSKKDAKKAVQDELKQFEKFAISRLKKKTKREFEPSILPQELVKTLNETLQEIKEPAEIKKLFNKVENIKKQSDLVSENAKSISDMFDELKQELLDNANDVTDEDFQEKDDDSRKALLLLLLLGNFDLSEKLKPALTNMLESFSTQSINQAEKEIKDLGGSKLSSAKQKEIIADVVNKRIDFILPEIDRVTQEKISADTYKTTDINALKQAVTDSYAISNDRSDFIADVEQRTIENTARIATAKESDVVAAVLVSDGQEFDGPCIDADGQVWSLSQAEGNILQHPKCHREFTFLTKDQVEELGGIDVE